MKKLALFDLDGTLFNTNDVNYWAYSKALSEKGYSIDYEYYCKYCNGRHYKVFLSGIIFNEDIIEFVHKRIILQCSRPPLLRLLLSACPHFSV